MVSIWVSIITNLVLATAQICMGYIYHSQGLLADGIHSLSDLLGDGLVIVAKKVSAQSPNHRYQYGYFKIEDLANLFMSLLMLFTGIALIIHSLAKLRPDANQVLVEWQMLLVFAIATVACKEGLFRYMRYEANRTRSMLLLSNAYHARSDAVSSLVVIVGIAGVAFDQPLLDPVAGIVMGVLITRVAQKFIKEAYSSLMDRSITEEQRDSILNQLLEISAIKSVASLKTRRSGDNLFIDVEISIDETKTLKEAYAIALQAKLKLLSQNNIYEVTVQLVPSRNS